VLRVGHHNLQPASFEDGKNWFPIDAGAFHRHMRTALREHPFPQAQQLARRGSEGPHLLLHFSIFPNN
jgi:hypothetical protein